MMRKRTSRSVLVLLTALFCLGAVPVFETVLGGGDAFAKATTKKVKPPRKRSARPSLSYRPDSSYGQPKYALRLGVMPLRDQRQARFYGGTDEFFAEPVMDVLQDTAYYELKSSSLFSGVVSLPPEDHSALSRERLAKMARQHGVDLIFVGDLLSFNMLREKMRASKKGADFNIKVRFGMFGQLIDARTGAVLWAEQVEREFSDLNTSGKVTGKDYGANATRALKAGFNDIKQFIRATGLEVSR